MESSDVLRALKQMPQAELRKVSAQAAHLLARNAVNVSPLEREVYESLCETIKMEGATSFPPFGGFTRTAAFPTFREGVGLFLEYIETYCKPKKRLERMKMVNVFMSMLARRLLRDGIPLSSKTMSSALSRVGGIVEEQFPGYRESGLLSVLLKKYRIE